jgi:hypothetical protein
MEAYKTFEINNKKVSCYDESEGFTLGIDGKRYHVYEDGGTQVDLVCGDDREYFDKISDTWVDDEEEAAKAILAILKQNSR